MIDLCVFFDVQQWKDGGQLMSERHMRETETPVCAQEQSVAHGGRTDNATTLPGGKSNNTHEEGN